MKLSTSIITIILFIIIPIKKNMAGGPPNHYWSSHKTMHTHFLPDKYTSEFEHGIALRAKTGPDFWQECLMEILIAPRPQDPESAKSFNFRILNQAFIIGKTYETKRIMGLAADKSSYKEAAYAIVGTSMGVFTAYVLHTAVSTAWERRNELITQCVAITKIP